MTAGRRTSGFLSGVARVTPHPYQRPEDAAARIWPQPVFPDVTPRTLRVEWRKKGAHAISRKKHPNGLLVLWEGAAISKRPEEYPLLADKETIEVSKSRAEGMPKGFVAWFWASD